MNNGTKLKFVERFWFSNTKQVRRHDSYFTEAVTQRGLAIKQLVPKSNVVTGGRDRLWYAAPSACFLSLGD